MRRITVLALLLLALPAAAQVDYHKTAVTRWVGPGRPTTHAEHLAAHPFQPLEWREVARKASPLDQTGPVLVVVEAELLPALQMEVDRWTDDLTAAGWDPILLTWAGGTPEDLREVLQSYYVSDSILGAALLGDLPQGWFELYEDFDNNGLPDEPYQVDFPCDLYFMDLDGDWYDGDVDGTLDTHLNAWQPEIFVGRLPASPLGNEVARLRSYLNRNHAFRTGDLFLPGRGLAYIDDDWAGGAEQWAQSFAQVAGLVDVVNDINVTTADDYLTRLDDGYYAYLLAAHSSPSLHSLKEQDGSIWNEVFNYEILQADPDAFFYNLFCCSACRYNEINYIGGCYLFGDQWALGVLGSAKTGSMLYFEDYYPVMDQGECAGEAFRQWFALHGQETGSVMWSMSWFYGMVHLGDPTLFLRVGLQVTEVEVIDDGSAGSSGDGDGTPDAGERVALNLTLFNHDQTPHTGLWMKLGTQSACASWVTDSVYVGSIPALGTAAANGFLLDLAANTADDTPINVGAEIRDPEAHLWGDSFILTVRAPLLVLTAYTLDEISGDGDPEVDPGESFGLHLTVQNRGGDHSPVAPFTVTSLSSQVQASPAASSLQMLAPGASGGSDLAVVLNVAPDCPADHAAVLKAVLAAPFAPLRLILQVGDHLAWSDPVTSPDDVLTHYAVSPGYLDQWHPSTQWFTSAPYSFKFGSPTIPYYYPLADGALETPLFPLGLAAELRFWHWLRAERGYDGGIVEIDAGEGWQLLSPQGGYNGTSQSNGSFPGGPAYSGTVDSCEAVFDLTGYSGFAKLRFRFGSDGGLQEEGWYVDEVQLSGDLAGVVPEGPASAAPRAFTLYAPHPNPFNPVTTASFELRTAGYVSLRVYDTAGREVRTLAGGWRDAGVHEVTFDGAGLASGVYLVRMEAGEFTATQKLVLLK
ncbi:MAG: T9SS C-terminal target domain-containing protein [Candidatus Zixiibacteriota bacterium]|nr:MAG: T9SS C-terminal target domain-containing protein [candidate division Zixibacteria bacterium]